MLQNITLGGAMIALPIFLQIKLEYDAMQTGLSIAPLSLTMFAVAILAGRRAGSRRPATIIRTGFALSTLGIALIIPIVPEARLRLVPPRPARDRREPGSACWSRSSTTTRSPRSTRSGSARRPG